jgi:Na+-translocating ferredoxin:NAD+ oxidoreductase RnfC subunit
VRKLGVKDYDVPAHFKDVKFTPKLVRIPLSQHLGSPAIPVVKVGQEVKAGQLLGDHSGEKISACIHSSIDGVVTELNNEIVIEQK